MKIAVFAYNFPHKKTQSFLLRLFYEKHLVDYVIAANPVELDIPESKVRVKANHIDLMEPKQLCERLGFPYDVVSHDDNQVIELANSKEINLGIIAGARILPQKVINAFNIGIINFHPGLIPEARGLDALKWTIYQDHPPGVTAHFIDERVDAGRIIERKKISVYDDDTLIDISLRLQQTEINMLPRVIEKVHDLGSLSDLEKVEGGSKNPPIPREKEDEIVERFPGWKRTYTG